MAKMFNERLESLKLGETEKAIRGKRLNMLMKTAIHNISKRKTDTDHGLSINAPVKSVDGDDDGNKQ